MYLTDKEVEVSWRRSLTNGLGRYSTHLFQVWMLYFMNAMAIFNLFRMFRYDPGVERRMTLVLVAFLAVHCLAGYFVLSMYKIMRRVLPAADHSSSLLYTSFIAFKLYTLFLAVSFLTLWAVPLVAEGGW